MFLVPFINNKLLKPTHRRVLFVGIIRYVYFTCMNTPGFSFIRKTIFYFIWIIYQYMTAL